MRPTQQGGRTKEKAAAKKAAVKKAAVKKAAPKKAAARKTPVGGETPIVFFEQPGAWSDWLARNHESSRGVWLKMAKKASGVASINYQEALEVALMWGWIDGQKQSHDDTSWLQTRRCRST